MATSFCVLLALAGCLSILLNRRKSKEFIIHKKGTLPFTVIWLKNTMYVHIHTSRIIYIQIRYIKQNDRVLFNILHKRAFINAVLIFFFRFLYKLLTIIVILLHAISLCLI